MDINLIKEAYKKKEFMFLRTNKSKEFYSLMPWKEINRILRQGRLQHPRLRLHKEGEAFNEESYVERKVLRRGGYDNKIIEQKFYELIENGATVVIDAIDELYEHLDLFVTEIERIFASKIQINAYMSWGNHRGFTTHWDDHDVLIFQVFGKKNWFVFNETRKHPLYRDLHEKHIPPQNPEWNNIIQAGDILFIPRGQWHHAVAMNEPSLHLTFGFECRTGISYIQWLQEKLTESEIFRKDLPCLATKKEILRQHNIIKKKIQEALGVHTLASYINELEVRMEHRPRFSLPWGISTAQKYSNCQLVFNVNMIADYKTNKATGIVSFMAKNKSYEFSLSCAPFFKLLMDYKPHDFKECSSILAEEVPEERFEEMVGYLVKDGLIAAIG